MTEQPLGKKIGNYWLTQKNARGTLNGEQFLQEFAPESFVCEKEQTTRLARLRKHLSSLTLFRKCIYALAGSICLMILAILMVVAAFEVLGNTVSAWSFLAGPSTQDMLALQLNILICSIFIVVLLYNELLWTNLFQNRKLALMMPGAIVTYVVVHLIASYFRLNWMEELSIFLLAGTILSYLIYRRF